MPKAYIWGRWSLDPWVFWLYSGCGWLAEHLTSTWDRSRGCSSSGRSLLFSQISIIELPRAGVSASIGPKSQSVMHASLATTIRCQPLVNKILIYNVIPKKYPYPCAYRRILFYPPPPCPTLMGIPNKFSLPCVIPLLVGAVHIFPGICSMYHNL